MPRVPIARASAASAMKAVFTIVRDPRCRDVAWIATAVRMPALGFDAGIMDHLGPFRHVRPDARRELVRRHGGRLEAERFHLLYQIRGRHRARGLAIKKIDDRARRAGGCPDALR